MSLDSMLDKFVEVAKLLRDKYNVDIQEVLERNEVITPNNIRWRIKLDDLLNDYELRDDVIDHYKWKTTKNRKLVQCRGNIYRKSDGKLMLGGWDGKKEYRVVSVTCNTIDGKREPFKMQYHTLAFTLYNKRWPRTPVVDHDDDNKLNNSGTNLNESDHSDNNHNRKRNRRLTEMPKMPQSAPQSPILSLYK